MRRPFSLTQRLSRLLHFRLIIPLKRSPHPPEYTARAVMVGLFWALTPLVGIQMYLVLMTWLVARKFPRLEFSLLIAVAWTWVTNVFTMWPAYYLFYITGKVLTGQIHQARGYQHFVDKWQTVLAAHEGFVETLYASIALIVHEQGVAMTVGCLPWAVLSAWLGYRWTLGYVNRRRRKRGERRHALWLKRLAKKKVAAERQAEAGADPLPGSTPAAVPDAASGD